MRPARTLIVYACPVGELADQLDRYLERVAEQVGPNEAHAYMPHISVTGFFHDTTPSIAAYAAAIERAMGEAGDDRAVAVDRMVLEPDFHYLAVSSPWLEEVGRGVARHAPAVTRVDAVRPKERLHISLAYGFAAHQHAAMVDLAQSLVQPTAAATWEVRFYERAGTGWTLHRSWPCGDG